MHESISLVRAARDWCSQLMNKTATARVELDQLKTTVKRSRATAATPIDTHETPCSTDHANQRSHVIAPWSPRAGATPTDLIQRKAPWNSMFDRKT
jgi:hypothetical protein